MNAFLMMGGKIWFNQKFFFSNEYECVLYKLKEYKFIVEFSILLQEINVCVHY